MLRSRGLSRASVHTSEYSGPLIKSVSSGVKARAASRGESGYFVIRHPYQGRDLGSRKRCQQNIECFMVCAVQTYKVAVWATGGVGRFAIRTIVDRPNFELVGAWVHSARKDGEDVGTLAGIPPVGVRASRDEASVLDGDADCVVYAARVGSRPKEAVADLCRILAAGKNVVTTSLPGLVYERGSLSERYLDAIRQAAQDGSSSIFSSGIEPGFGCDLFPIALMTMSHKVYSVRGIEITDYSRYPVEFDMRELFGFGQPLDYQGGLKSPGVLTWGWGAAVTMVADALGVELDEIRETCEFLPTPRRLETACGVIEAGTVRATEAKWLGAGG